MEVEKMSFPKDWKVVRLGDVAELNPKIPGREQLDDEMPVQFLPMKAVEEVSGRIHLDEERRYGDVKKSYTAFINGDVLFAKVTPCMENGKVAVANNLKNGIGLGSSEFHVLRSTGQVLSEYLFHFLVQKNFRNEAQAAMTGAVGLRRVPKQFLENYSLPLPPLAEQQRIVAKIEELFSELDAGKRELEAAAQGLKGYRQAVLKWAFEGRLTNDAVVDGELPDSWAMKPLGEVCKTTSGGTPNRKRSDFYEGNIPWVKSGELGQGLVVDTEEKITATAIENSSAKIFPKGTLLIALYGATIGKLAFLGTDAATNQAVCGIFESKAIVHQFLFHYLHYQKRTLINQAIGGAQPNISQGILKGLPVPLPPLEEQHRIVQEIEARLSVCDKMEGTIAESLQQAEALRQSILKKAFEGKLL